MKKKTLSTPHQRPFTIKRASEYLDLSDDTIRRLIKQGVLRSSMITRKILIPAADVENLVESTC